MSASCSIGGYVAGPEKRIKREPGIKVAVWFDRPRDCLCFADRLNERWKDGQPVPDDAVVRIPLSDGEEFIDALINKASAGDDLSKILHGVQDLLDRRAAQAVGLSERLRSERRRLSGGGAVDSNAQGVTVAMHEIEFLRNLHRLVGNLLSDRESVPSDGLLLDEIQSFIEGGPKSECASNGSR